MKDVRLDWMERFAALEQCMREAGDEQNSDRMRDLMRKAARKEWIVAFCGHFSAGKSTMLNQLFGQRILPTSPIPTSANVVRIQKGEDRVKLVFMTGRSVIIPGKADDQDLKSWCKNGEEVREVHVFRSDAPLPAQVVLMDTPGIDSTDEAHHQMTEAALHLADVIFYVMDYNHVQSEINLRFVKKLAERGKRVVLVVNQIDKHQEQELPFDVYQRNVESSFGEWGIPVEKIYYTSLAQPDFPGNQWGDLKEGMKALMQERKHGMRQSWETEANHLVKSHLSFMNGKWEPLLQACQEKMREVSENEGENLDERKERLQAELDRLQRSDRPEAAMLQGLEDILKNAYLMPFELRELARLYLETVLTPFKVGFLFSKSKTEQEKKRREEAFLEKLREVVQAQCGVHVKDYLLRFAKESGLPAHWEERIYSHSLKLTAEFLRRVIKPGAAFTDAYLLTYTDDLAEEIKRGYRSWALGLADEWKDDWRKSAEERGKRLKQELKRLHQQEEAKKEWERIQQERREWQQRLADCLSGKNRLPIEWGTWLADEGEWVRDRSEWEKWFHSVTTVEPSESETEPVPLAEGPVLPSHGSPDEALERIRRAIGIMEPVDALAAIREELIEKLRRAEEKRFTVALFGAFSAGKSSLANALIGKKVFAVSPHPTTATIQKIVPPTESLPHGQGIIRFKTKERLHEELKNALRLFERKAETWEEAVKALPEALQSEIHHPRQKLARPFLEAVHHGLRQFQGCLGTQEVADFAVCRS